MKQFVLGAAFGLACAAAFYPAAHGATGLAAYKALDRFAMGFEAVRKNYVREIDDAKLIDTALQGMVSGLDAHSSYMTAAEYAEARATTAGAHAGVGLELALKDGMPRIVSAIDDTPAYKAGIKPGDLVAAVDGKATVDMPLADVIAMLRGDAGSKVTLTVLRAGAAPMDVTMTRALIRTVPVRFERKGQIGYVRVASFITSTAPDIEKAVRELKKQIGPALKGFVIDLRNDPGGLLDQSILVADDFLASGNIVSTKGRSAADTQIYDARADDIADGKPIVVLIDEGTAAGAEIVAAALQDGHRATIVGMRSFGRGTIQTVIPLGDDGGAFRLTTAQFFRPSGQPIQFTGVTPDVAVAKAPARAAGDPQLAKALEQLGG